MLTQLETCSVNLFEKNPNLNNYNEASVNGESSLGSLRPVYYSRSGGVVIPDFVQMNLPQFRPNNFVDEPLDTLGPLTPGTSGLRIFLKGISVYGFTPLRGSNKYGRATLGIRFDYIHNKNRISRLKEIPLTVFLKDTAAGRRIRMCYADFDESILKSMETLCHQMGMNIHWENLGNLESTDSCDAVGIAAGRCRISPICTFGNGNNNLTTGSKLCELEKRILKNSPLGGDTQFCRIPQRIGGTPLSARGFEDNVCDILSPPDALVPKIVEINYGGGPVKYCRR